MLPGSEELLQLFIEYTPVAIAICDLEMRYVAVSKRWMTDYSLGDQSIIGRSHYDVFPDIPERWKALHRRGISGEVLSSRADKFERADGTIEWLEWEIQPWHKPDGNIGGIVFFSKNINDRKQAEDALNKSANEIEDLYQHAACGYHSLDKDGLIIRINDTELAWLGYTREEIVGRVKWQNIITPKSLEIFQANYSIFKKEGTVSNLELEMFRKDGSILIALVNATAVFDANGTYLMSRSTVTDITERKQAELGMRRNEDLFRTVTEASPLAIFVSSGAEQQYKYVNPTAVKLFGYTIDEIKQVDDWWPLAYPDPDYRHWVIEEWERKVAKAIETQSAIEPMTVVVTSKNGSEKYIQWGFSSIGDLNVAFGLDLTERTHAQQALMRSERTLRVLSSCNEALMRADTETELLNDVCRLIVEKGGYLMAWIGFAENDEVKTVRPIAEFGDKTAFLSNANITWADTERGHGPTGTAIRMGIPTVCQCCQTNPLVHPWREALIKGGFNSSIALPFIYEKQVLGSLTIYAPEAWAFGEEETNLLTQLAGNLGYGIEALRNRAERDRKSSENLRQQKIIQDNLESFVKTLSNTLEMRDSYTAWHQRNVGVLAVAIAQELGLPEDTIHGIELAAWVHDIGKISVPAEILTKPTRLTSFERMIVENHAQAGYELLKEVEFSWPIAAMVWQHHERLDGSGYPQGLKGDQILLGSRILAVADVVESMSSDRPYRPALGIDTALREIERGKGSIYDQSVADACIKLFAEKRDVLLDKIFTTIHE